jgi:hypothetical protein
LVISEPQILRSLPSNGTSVAIAWPTISTAWSRSPCSSTKRSDASTAAAAPDDVGQHCSRVSGSHIIRDSSTSSSVHAAWYWERGLLTECSWFFTATLANCSAVVP